PQRRGSNEPRRGHSVWSAAGLRTMMNRGRSGLVLGAALAAAVTSAAQRPVSTKSGGPVAELQRTQSEWLGALNRGDRPAVERILAPEFTFTGRSGRVRGRAEEIAGVQPPTDSTNRLLEIYADDQRVHVFDHAGVIHGRVIEIGLRGGQPYHLV